MIQNTGNKLGIWLTMSVVLLGATIAVGQRQAGNKNGLVSTPQQPLYSEYRGVRIGMSAADVRIKLGSSLQQADEMDIYVFSDKETAQIVYDTLHKVRMISIDYVGGVGAPDYKSVVGSDIDVREDGTLYKLARYDNVGIWVYYNRGPGDNATVSITIQKSLTGP
jgi:hypothetical protein